MANGDPKPTASGALSRRKILGGLAAGTVVLGVPGVAAAQDGGRRRGGNRRRPQPSAAGPDRFSRIFGGAEPFAEVDDELTTMLATLGAPGGLLDAKDPLEEGPIRLITRDAGSTLSQSTSVRRSTNLRSAQFDLDSVYGGNPADSPQIYVADDNILFRVESGGVFEDLPRDAGGQAIIADGRNDENLIIAGLQVAFLKFHNAVVERVRATTDLDDDAAFIEARRIVTWHYQWLILHQFLPQFVGQSMVDEILANGRQYYTTSTPRIPVEFQTSAYRFGHSMIRPSYRANLAGDNGEPFFGMVFDPAEFGKPDPDDMNGGSRAPRRFIGWQTFFDFDDGEVKPNKKIDTHISTPLFQLPIGSIAGADWRPSLPARAGGDDFRMADLLTVAGVDPATRGQ